VKKLVFWSLICLTLTSGNALGQPIQPLTEILLDLGGMTEAQARRIAALQAKEQWKMDKGPNYKSTPDHDNGDPNVLSDDLQFEGYWIPSLNNSKMAVFSDDGCDVWINGQLVMNNFKKGQHLPDLRQSFHVVKASPTSNRPYPFKQGQSYYIQIHYGNTIFNGKTDIDGVTLFAMGGGGEPIDLVITDVRGLYKEDGKYEKGYKSTDDKGRIYSDRAYDATNPNKHKWARHKNYVDITVEVRPAGTKLPDAARVVWTSEDPDDPSNDPDTAADAGVLIDPNDYKNGILDGFNGNDNTGHRYGDEWEQYSADYALENKNETKLKNGRSIVRFNVQNHGGDNFIAKPRLRLEPGKEPSKGDQTGIMTTWKYIQLENARMKDADKLPLDRLNAFFQKAFVVWDVAPTREVDNKDPLGQTDREASRASDEYVKAPPFGQFEHAGQGGWFFLASAMRYDGEADRAPERLINFKDDNMSTVLRSSRVPDVRITSGVIELPKAIPAGKELGSIRIYKDDARSARLSLRAIFKPGSRDTIYVISPFYQPPDDPNSVVLKDLADFGFGRGDKIRVDAYGKGSFRTEGIRAC
jgi:hypothetical protein